MTQTKSVKINDIAFFPLVLNITVGGLSVVSEFGVADGPKSQVNCVVG